MIPDVRILIRRLGKVEVPLPRYQTPASAGMDLHAALEAPLTLAPLQRTKVPTGLAIAMPPQVEAQIRPRSGLAARTGLTILNAPGTIDADYRGEIQILMVNLGDQPAVIEPLERIAQMVLAPVARGELVLVAELPESVRGEGGYGSTGRK